MAVCRIGMPPFYYKAMKKSNLIFMAVGMFAFSMNLSANRTVEGSRVESLDQSTQSVPLVALSKTYCDFGNVYIGEKVLSEVITLKNTGAGVLKIPSILYPSGFDLSMDLKKVELKKNETVSFKISYKSQMFSDTDAMFVFKTNGGDVPLRVVANKVALPKGASFEGFENGCSPIGWSSNGWSYKKYALEGDLAVCSTGSSDGVCELKTPRLDLSKGAHRVIFTAFNSFESDMEGDAPENDVTLQFSKDGGLTWTTVWASEKVNEIDNATVDLGNPKSDNCYLKWVFGAVAFDAEKIAESSTFYLDRVVLPKFYGAGGVPGATKCVTPVNGAVNVLIREVEFMWEPVLFATEYKIYVGTNAEANDIINGEPTANDTRVWLRGLDGATTYYWRVVPYNEKGEAQNVETWSFTTEAAQTVTRGHSSCK